MDHLGFDIGFLVLVGLTTIDELLIRLGVEGSQSFRREFQEARKEVKKTTGEARNEFKKASKSIERDSKSIVGSLKSIGTAIKAFIGLAVVREVGRTVLSITSLASRTDAVRKAFEKMATGSGVNPAAYMREIQAASKGTLSNMSALVVANTALSSKIEPLYRNLGSIIENIRIVSTSLGRSASQDIERVISAINKQEQELLDELGIVARAETAYNNFAAAVGKSASQLSDMERRTAFANLVIDALREKAEAVGDTTNKLGDRWGKFGARIENLGARIGRAMVGPLGKIVDLATRAVGATDELIDKIQEAEKQQRRMLREQDQNARGFFSRLLFGAPIETQEMRREAQTGGAPTPAEFALSAARGQARIKNASRLLDDYLAVTRPRSLPESTVGGRNPWEVAAEIPLEDIEVQFRDLADGAAEATEKAAKQMRDLLVNNLKEVAEKGGAALDQIPLQLHDKVLRVLSAISISLNSLGISSSGRIGSAISGGTNLALGLGALKGLGPLALGVPGLNTFVGGIAAFSGAVSVFKGLFGGSGSSLQPIPFQPHPTNQADITDLQDTVASLQGRLEYLKELQSEGTRMFEGQPIQNVINRTRADLDFAQSSLDSTKTGRAAGSQQFSEIATITQETAGVLVANSDTMVAQLNDLLRQGDRRDRHLRNIEVHSARSAGGMILRSQGVG